MTKTKRNCNTVANGKGGVGKTTTVLEVLSHASDKNFNKKLLAIDLDPSGNLGKRLTGKKIPENGQLTITDYLLNPKQVNPEDLLEEATDGWPNTYLIRSDNELTNVCLRIATQGGWDRRLHKLVGQLSEFFEFIIIDTGPTLGMLHTMAFKASDRVIIPADTGSDDALDGVKDVQTIIDILRDDDPNFCPKKIIAFIAASHKSNSEPSRIAKNEFERQLGGVFYPDLTIPHRAIVGKAVWKHTPPIPAKLLAKNSDAVFQNYKKLSSLLV